MTVAIGRNENTYEKGRRSSLLPSILIDIAYCGTFGTTFIIRAAEADTYRQALLRYDAATHFDYFYT